ncbi:two-component sensor histidine kinase [Streptomyces tsukubensis]|nr:histidine kinase [Streptomyces tsukubensis]QFR97865.1 two-component sensor histidine kinase [Streptomyces tsukubensis]
MTGAFALRPLGKLDTSDEGRLGRLPSRWRGYVAWLPHAAILFAVVCVALLAVQDSGGLLSVLVAVLAIAPLVLLLTRPVGAWWLSVAGTFLTVVLMVDPGDGLYPWSIPGYATYLVVMTGVSLVSRPRVAVEMWGLTALIGIITVVPSGMPAAPVLGMLVLGAFTLTAAASVGGWLSARREVAVKEQEVAVKEEVTLVERSRRTLLEERTTIARELHDVVAHHMSVVAIQAEAAPYRVEDPPPELAAAFVTIRENAVAALTELRRVLGVVRAEDQDLPDAPQPTLLDLDALLANVEEAGLTVSRTVTGAVRELPQGVELSAYRIIQEALSNTLRHAPGAQAAVELSYVLGGLGLRIINGPSTGGGAGVPGAGHGLTGMRERVTMLDGEMTAGATDDGGFEVAAFLPVPSEQRVEESV